MGIFALGFGKDDNAKAFLVGGLVLGGGLAFAVNFGEKPDTPQLPGVPWVVHDGTRPQPRKVETKSAVAVPAPADAKILFDGGNLDAWTGADWKVTDGVLTAADRDLRTKEEFRDVQMHIEWRVPAELKVNGQTGGNSGIFLMGLYEVQVLASYQNRTYPPIIPKLDRSASSGTTIPSGSATSGSARSENTTNRSNLLQIPRIFVMTPPRSN